MKTIKETIAAIRAANMAGSYDAGEWRITFRKDDMPDKDRREAVAAYCYDSDDALSTAQVMRERFERIPTIWEALSNIGG